MRTRIALLAISALSLAGLIGAPASQAAGSLCYDVHVATPVQNVDQTGCQALPV